VTKARPAAKPERWLVELTRAGSNANAKGVRKWLLRVRARRWALVALLAAILVLSSLIVVLVGSRDRKSVV